MRFKVDVSTSQNGNTKTITTKTTQYITVRDIIGAVAGLASLGSALFSKRPEISAKAPALAGLIAPVAALATALGIVQKISMVAGMVTPAIQIAARASGVWASPGNVGDIIKIVLTTVSKILIALALGAVQMLIDMFLNWEFKIKEISESKSQIIAQQLENTGNVIAGAINDSVAGIGAAPLDPTNKVNEGNTGTPNDVTAGDILDNAFDQNTGTIVSEGTTPVITGKDSDNGDYHNFGIIIEARMYGSKFLLAGSNEDEGIWWSDDDGDIWHQSDKQDGNFAAFAFNQYWFSGNCDHVVENTPNYSFGISPNTGTNLRNANFYLKLPEQLVTGTGFSTIVRENNTITGDKDDFDFVVEERTDVEGNITKHLVIKKLLQSYKNYPLTFEFTTPTNIMVQGDTIPNKTIWFNQEVQHSNGAFTQIAFIEDIEDNTGRYWILEFADNHIIMREYQDQNMVLETPIYSREGVYPPGSPSDPNYVDDPNSTENLFDRNNPNNKINELFTEDFIYTWNQTQYDFNTEYNIKVANVFTIPEILIQVGENTVRAYEWFPAFTILKGEYVLFNNEIYYCIEDDIYNEEIEDTSTIFFNTSKFVKVEDMPPPDMPIVPPNEPQPTPEPAPEVKIISREDYNTFYMKSICGKEQVENVINFVTQDITNLTFYKIPNNKDYIIKEFLGSYPNFYTMMYESYYNYTNVFGQGIFYSNDGKHWQITNIDKHSWNDLKLIRGSSSEHFINTIQTNWVSIIFNNKIYIIDKNDNSQIFKINADDSIQQIAGVQGFDTPIEFNGALYIFGYNVDCIKLKSDDTYEITNVPQGYWEPFLFNNRIYAIESTQESNRILYINSDDTYNIINLPSQKRWFSPITTYNEFISKDVLIVFADDRYLQIDSDDNTYEFAETPEYMGADTPIKLDDTHIIVFGDNNSKALNINTGTPSIEPTISEENAAGFNMPIIFNNHLYSFGTDKSYFYYFEDYTNRITIPLPTNYCRAIEFNNHLYLFFDGISDKCYIMDVNNNFTEFNIGASADWTPYIFSGRLWLFSSTDQKLATIDPYGIISNRGLDFIYDYPLEYNGFLYVISSQEHNKIIKLTEDIDETARVAAVNASDAGIYYCNTGDYNFNISNIDWGSFKEIMLFPQDAQPKDAIVIGEHSYDTQNTGANWTILNGYNFLCIIGYDSRLIAGSGNNTGLWYSDDFGLTWTQSNKTDGSWGALIRYEDLIVAGSADNQGIMYSEDIGETYNKTNVENGMYNSFSEGDV